ncbi:rab15 effector protein isoform X2 [Phycodurus eques]|uniref:rab15 effector protein isoform X2 n=1 Tax=Phycodurus eques TaxID=693459 RepID=UPI002ACD3BA8|nr:rab15 effector protein isoform X2 [Phycodurus eques]
MGESMSKPSVAPFQDVAFFTAFKPYNLPPTNNTPPRPSIFSTLRRPPVAKPNEFIPLFSDCIAAASSRTQEYLLFKDPEDKFHPSPEALTQIFLMTYISQSVNLNLTDIFNCTAMTPEQRILLGADWVWAVLEKSTKNPRIQIAVQVRHLSDKEDGEEDAALPETCSETVQMAQRESSDRNMEEKRQEQYLRRTQQQL